MIPSLRHRRWLLPVLAGLLSLALLLGWLALPHLPAALAVVKSGSQTLVEWLRHTNPWLFFGGLALLPIVGMPISPFYLTAGVFGAGFGILGCLVAVSANLAICYWLARGLFRPFLERLLRRRGWSIPQVRDDNRLRLLLLIRLTPGLPFFLQNYVLGLSGLPFRIYLPYSILLQSPFVIGVILVGDSLMRGKAGAALTGISLVVAAVILTRMLRSRYAKPLDQPVGG